jgi:hypothetical protein
MLVKDWIWSREIIPARKARHSADWFGTSIFCSIAGGEVEAKIPIVWEQEWKRGLRGFSRSVRSSSNIQAVLFGVWGFQHSCG